MTLWEKTFYCVWLFTVTYVLVLGQEFPAAHHNVTRRVTAIMMTVIIAGAAYAAASIMESVH